MKLKVLKFLLSVVGVPVGIAGAFALIFSGWLYGFYLKIEKKEKARLN